MQSIVIDTNVLVSALIQRNYPYLILNNLTSGKDIKICISDEVLSEYYAVLKRPKFSQYHDFFSHAEILLSDLERIGVKFYPLKKLHIIKDVDDNKFLELCLEADTDYLITGNSKDFTMKQFNKTLIVTPQVYWEIYLNH